MFLQSDLPPIRNSLDQKKLKKKKKPKHEKKTSEKKVKKIKSSDYRSWDKFNVEKALDEIDEQKSSSASEYETDEEWEIERKQKQAVWFKDQVIKINLMVISFPF